MIQHENTISIHNFYLVGKDNFITGNKLNVLSRDILPPTRFNFGETIQEVGFDIKLSHKDFKYYENNETIVVFEPYHFKDFDNQDLNIWTYFELLFHQNILYGVSFSSSKIEIYNKFLNYLVSIYGDFTKVPDQKNTILTVAWFIYDHNTSVYLEVEDKGNGQKLIVLTYYHILIHQGVKNNVYVYSIGRQDAYSRDKKQITDYNTKFNIQNKNGKLISFQQLKSHVEFELIKNDRFKEITSFLLNNLTPEDLNLEIVDWLIEIAVKIQERFFFYEARQLYGLIINWKDSTAYFPNKERVELIAFAYKNLINVFGDDNKHEEAIVSFNSCIEFINNNLPFLNNYSYQFISGQAYYNIARVYSSIKDYSKAIGHCKESIKKIEFFVSPWINQEEITTGLLAITNLGNYLSVVGNHKEAIEHYAMGINFAIDNKRFYDSSVMSMNLAYVLFEAEKYIEAEKHFMNILDLINKEPRIYEGTLLKGTVLINLANLYKKIDNKEMGIEFLDKAILFYSMSSLNSQRKEELLFDLIRRKSEF